MRLDEPFVEGLNERTVERVGDICWYELLEHAAAQIRCVGRRDDGDTTIQYCLRMIYLSSSVPSWKGGSPQSPFRLRVGRHLLKDPSAECVVILEGPIHVRGVLLHRRVDGIGMLLSRRPWRQRP